MIKAGHFWEYKVGINVIIANFMCYENVDLMISECCFSFQLQLMSFLRKNHG